MSEEQNQKPQSTDKSKIIAALVKFHENLKRPSKNGNNPYLNNDYVTLEAVQNAVDEASKGTGLTYIQQVFDLNGSNDKAVQTTILHESGETLTSGPLTLSPQKKDPQGYGSALTYEKRYQLSAMFGISSELDDDGNKASGAANKNNQKQNAYPQRQYQQGRNTGFQQNRNYNGGNNQ
ncbi:ERF family protein [Lactobacillaceae bacterium 24-114]